MSEKRYWECSKQKCKWRGTCDEKVDKTDSKHSFVTHHVCPICGNDSFYELTAKQIKNFLAKKDKILKAGDEVKFNSGNYSGLTGVIIETDWSSKNPKAIYGAWHTVKLSNGEISHIEKSEHYEKIKNK